MFIPTGQARSPVVSCCSPRKNKQKAFKFETYSPITTTWDGMEPSEIEFLAESLVVSVVPNFNEGVMYLLSGEFGPFRAGLPLKVPLWLAVNLRSRRKCR